MSRLLCPTRFWHFQAIKIFIQNVRFWRDISLADFSIFNLQAISKEVDLNKMNSQLNFWHGCYLSRWKLWTLRSASRDVHDREQCPINLHLWRDSRDVENIQVGKSHWNIKKIPIMDPILYLFFRTWDGKRIYFLILLAMKKWFYMCSCKKDKFDISKRKGPMLVPASWASLKLCGNQCAPEDNVLAMLCLRPACFWC